MMDECRDCSCTLDRCQPLWAEQRKCCPDCDHRAALESVFAEPGITAGQGHAGRVATVDLAEILGDEAPTMYARLWVPGDDEPVITSPLPITDGGLAEAGFVPIGYVDDDGIQVRPSADDDEDQDDDAELIRPTRGCLIVEIGGERFTL